MVVIGGGKTLYGPLLGSFVTVWLRELIHMYLKGILPVMRAEVDAIFFGMLIIVILIFMPGGLAGGIDQLFSLGRKVFARDLDT